MTSLSMHFSLEELTRSKPGILNTPTPRVLHNLSKVALKLEEARAILGQPIRISYGYRCKELNDSCGGSPTSVHLSGLAADMIPQGGLILEHAVEMLLDDPEFMMDVDQLIIERGCIHLGLPQPRMEYRYETFVDGKRHYPLKFVWGAP